MAIASDATFVLPRLRPLPPMVAQVARYAAVGGLGTLTSALVFLTLRTWWDAVPANLVALVVSTLLSTEINRRFTFGAAQPAHRWRVYAQNGGTVAFYACYGSVVLLVLAAFVDRPSPLLESATLAAASLLGGLVRFLVLRYWVFEPRTP